MINMQQYKVHLSNQSEKLKTKGKENCAMQESDFQTDLDFKNKKKKRKHDKETKVDPVSEGNEDNMAQFPKKKKTKRKHEDLQCDDFSVLTENGVQNLKKKKKKRKSEGEVKDAPVIIAVEEENVKRKKRKRRERDVEKEVVSNNATQKEAKETIGEKSLGEDVGTADPLTYAQDGGQKKKRKRQRSCDKSVQHEEKISLDADELKGKKRHTESGESEIMLLNDQENSQNDIKKKKKKKKRHKQSDETDVNSFLHDQDNSQNENENKKKNRHKQQLMESDTIVQYDQENFDEIKKKKKKKERHKQSDETDITVQHGQENLQDEGKKKKKKKKKHKQSDELDVIDQHELGNPSGKDEEHSPQERTFNEISSSENSYYKQLGETFQDEFKSFLVDCPIKTEVLWDDENPSIADPAFGTSDIPCNFDITHNVNGKHGAQDKNMQKNIKKKKGKAPISAELVLKPVATGLYPVHCVESRAHAVSKKMEDELRAKGVKFLRGKWNKQEDSILRRNVLQFAEDNGIEDPVELFTVKHQKESKRLLLKRLMKQNDFNHCMVDGINRSIYCCYNRARAIFLDTCMGPFSEEEIQTLKRLQFEHGNKWMKIGLLMGRSPNSVHTKWKNLQERRDKGEIKKGEWTEEEAKQLRDGVVAVTGTDEIHEDLLWSEIALFVPTRTASQCRNRWLEHGGVFPASQKAKLIEYLYKCDVECEADVNWRGIFEKLQGVPSVQALRKKWFRMKMEVPLYTYKTFREIVEKLYKDLKKKDNGEQ